MVTYLINGVVMNKFLLTSSLILIAALGCNNYRDYSMSSPDSLEEVVVEKKQNELSSFKEMSESFQVLSDEQKK